MRDSKQLWGRVRDIQKLKGTGGNSERQPTAIRDSGRHAATPWEWGDCKRQPVTIRISDRHAETQRKWKNIERHVATP